ncbi:hypothetical protein D3C81_2227730 [compost metagenome]
MDVYMKRSRAKHIRLAFEETADIQRFLNVRLKPLGHHLLHMKLHIHHSKQTKIIIAI